MGLDKCRHVPQFFYMKRHGTTVLLVAKIVDEMLATGEISFEKSFIEKFNRQFSLGTLNYGPGLLRFHGLNIHQHEDHHCTIDGLSLIHI